MYSELIYTRCRQGIDILKGGRSILSDGFKVYSCSGEILNGDSEDMPLLFNTVQSKEPYSDPAFMDDAYVYAVPDKGHRIMVDFHPVPFDKNAKGDYAHRPGNFVNQAFVGDFEDVYPFELFGNNGTWDAQLRGEAFYYENEPSPLEPRRELSDSGGSITSSDIARFIADGRKDAVKAAITFIIEQYRLPPESRKYLVIRDESSGFLELWIAAIESAFSPRMASGLPFATRMDKFVTTNRYTVNQNGLYQTQINLQDPKQKQRFRAMIVGVDERDKTNASVRSLPNTPYVILDGKLRKFDYAADTSSGYYTLVTSHDERHAGFCREFLQMLDIKQPTADVLKLYDAYVALEGVFSGSTVRRIASGLAVLENYKMLPCAYLSGLYSAIKGDLSRYLKENLLDAFTVLKWLQKIAPIAGDEKASEAFEAIVSSAFADCVYGEPLGKRTTEFWTSIRNSGFLDAAASHLVRGETFKSYETAVVKYDADAWIAFCQVFLPCAVKAHSYTPDRLCQVAKASIDACLDAGDSKKALQIAEMMHQLDAQVSKDLLLNIACEADTRKPEHYIWLLLRTDSGLARSDKAIFDLAQFLQQREQDRLCGYVLEYRAKSLSVPSDMVRFLEALLKNPMLKGRDLSAIYTAMDSRLRLDDKNSVQVAALLQETRSEKTSCPVSAHICALDALGARKGRGSLADEFESYAKQGFPNVEDEDYVARLAKSLLNSKLSGNDFEIIVGMIAPSTIYAHALSREIIGMTTERNSYAWNVLIDAFAQKGGAAAAGILSDELMEARKSDRQLDQLQGMLNSRKAQDWFSQVIKSIQDERERSVPKSGFGRLFGFGKKKK